MQTNDLAQSPAQNDIITPQAYDTYGRETIQYLPYTIAANGGALRTAALTEQAAFYNSLDGGFGYTEQVLENSPLSRPKEVKPPGSFYRQHPATTAYTTNAANEVRNFRQTGSSAWFAANRLYKTTATDENGVLTHSYKDRLGRTLMVNRAGAKTYYVFDNTSNLWAVIPPEASVVLEPLSSWTPVSGVYQDRIYKYNYDLYTLNLNSKRVPGTTTTYNYWYDRLDRVVMSRDPAQTKIVTKYDVLGRPVIVGKYSGTATPLSTDGLYETRNTVAPHYYTTTTSFPTDAANIQVYTVNYYDNYDVDGNGSLSAAENFNTPPSGYPAPTLRTRGKLTVAKNAVLPADGSAPTQYLHQRTWLDLKGRTVQSKTENHLAGQDVVFSAYKFPGWLEKTRREHTATPPGGTLKTININQQMTYDHAGRLLKTEQKIDGEAAFTTLSEQSWSERNLLTQKKLHKTSGGTFLQTLDYAYNIRGWLERINDFTTTADLFHLQLTYKTGDPAVNSGYTGGAGANWNGNITTMEWQANNGTRRLYACFYDGRDELLSANYVERNGAAFNQNNNYTDANTYDLNGNIKTCTRRGWLGSAYGVTDQLTYTYDGTYRDRLIKVADVGSATRGFLHTPPASGNHYIYDSNGNLSTDHHKKATFAYNYLNLPRSITFTTTVPNPKIEWLYDAAGMKLTKKLYSGSTLTGSKNYINGIEYNGANLEAIYHADGRLLPNGAAWHYDYTLKDHLGNARVTFRASGSTWTNVEEMHYYPFGMQMENAGTANPTNKYLYNGKERNEDFGLNWCDYGKRWYDVSIARFPSVDPIIEKLPYLTPYNYASNDPVGRIDLYGLQGTRTAAAFGSLLGFFDAAIADLTGFDLPDPDLGTAGNAAFSTAQTATHIGMLAVGGAEMVGGAGTMTAGATALATGVGAPPGAVAVVGGAALTLHGGFVINNAAKNLAESTKNSRREMPLPDDLQGGSQLPPDRIVSPPKKRGNAPVGDDGHPVDLHHTEQTMEGPVNEMTQTDHRGKGNFGKNHENTGQQPSNIDRKEFEKQRKKYWQNQWDTGRWENPEQ